MFKDILEKFNNRNILILVSFLLIAGIIFTYQILNIEQGSGIYFFDVGQGDSQLIEHKGVQILIDGGPPKGMLINELAETLPFYDRYIDIVVITHPQLDHFGGLIEVLKRYKVGLVLYTGRKSKSQTAKDFEKYVRENKVQGLKVASGDKITFKEMKLKVLLPDSKTINYDDLNDSSIVLSGDINHKTMLFTGDIGQKVEKHIIDQVSSVDIYKVAHHGSKYSNNLKFLKKLKPKVSLIQSGDNSYGHPTDEVLDRLNRIGSEVFRNDKDGTIRIVLEDESLKVFTKK